MVLLAKLLIGVVVGYVGEEHLLMLLVIVEWYNLCERGGSVVKFSNQSHMTIF